MTVYKLIPYGRGEWWTVEYEIRLNIRGDGEEETHFIKRSKDFPTIDDALEFIKAEVTEEAEEIKRVRDLSGGL